MVALAAVFSFAACESGPEDEKKPTPDGGKIATPVIEIKDVVADGFTAQWAAVENAQSYNVVLSKANSSQNQQKSVDTTSITFTNLGIGTYTVSVKAVAKDGYKDSDYGKNTATVEGLTEADWFEMSLFVSDDEELIKAGYAPYNSLAYTMKGKNIVSVMCAVFPTASLDEMSKEEIISELSALESNYIEYINSENGLYSAIGKLPSNTDITLYALAENADGATVLTSASAKTMEAVYPDSVKPWIGTYKATTTKQFSYAIVGQGENEAEDINVTDKTEEFEVTIDYDFKSDVIVVDGLSTLGGGWPALAEIDDKGALNVYSGISLGTDKDGMEYAWAVYGGIYGPSADAESDEMELLGYQMFFDAIYSHSFTMAEDKTISCAMGEYQLNDQNGNPSDQVMRVLVNEVFGFDSQYTYFLIKEFPALYRAGEVALVKTSDEVKDLTATTQSAEMKHAVPTTVAPARVY